MHGHRRAAGIVAILNADTSALAQRVYNIARGELTSTFDIAAAAQAAIPGADIKVGDAMTAFETATLKQRAPLPSDAAAKAFGYRSRFALADGVRRYADIYRAYKSGGRFPA